MSKFSISHDYFADLKNSIKRWESHTCLILDYMIFLLKKGWTKNNLAVDCWGNLVDISSKNAIKWSLIGSLDLSVIKNYDAWESRSLIYFLIDYICVQNGYTSIIDFNDHPFTTQEDVIDLVVSLKEELTKYNQLEKNE